MLNNETPLPHGDIVICPFCKNKFVYKVVTKNAGMLSCGNHDFPMVSGIIYLINNRNAKNALSHIRRGHYLLAYVDLLNLNKKLLIVFMLLGLNIRISFRNFIRLANIFGYDEKWSEYLNKRIDSNSYKLTKEYSGLFNKGDIVFDFGCGVGQLLPSLARKTGVNKLIAIDNSFANLIIAKKYFTPKGAMLICADGKNAFPFLNDSINRVVATDSFHYIKSKDYFINECHRVLKKFGQLLVFQTINSRGKVFGNIKGITPNNMLRILKKNKFRKIIIIGDVSTMASKISKESISKINKYDKKPFSVFSEK